MTITKERWKEISKVLKQYRIPYTAHLEERFVQKESSEEPVTVHDKYVLINFVIPDYYEEE